MQAFLDLYPFVHYDDDSLCAGLSVETRACLPETDLEGRLGSMWTRYSSATVSPLPEPSIVLKPEPEETFDQVRELATSPVPLGLLVKSEGLKWSPNTSTAADGDLIDFESDCIQPVLFPCIVPISPACNDLLEIVFLPCLPLPPPLPVSSLPNMKCLPVPCRPRGSF